MTHQHISKKPSTLALVITAWLSLFSPTEASLLIIPGSRKAPHDILVQHFKDFPEDSNDIILTKPSEPGVFAISGVETVCTRNGNKATALTTFPPDSGVVPLSEATLLKYSPSDSGFAFYQACMNAETLAVAKAQQWKKAMSREL